MKKSKLILNVVMAIFGFSFFLNTASVEAVSAEDIARTICGESLAGEFNPTACNTEVLYDSNYGSNVVIATNYCESIRSGVAAGSCIEEVGSDILPWLREIQALAVEVCNERGVSSASAEINTCEQGVRRGGFSSAEVADYCQGLGSGSGAVLTECREDFSNLTAQAIGQSGTYNAPAQTGGEDGAAGGGTPSANGQGTGVTVNLNNCANGKSFLGLPSWYEGLPSADIDGSCQIYVVKSDFEELCASASAEQTVGEDYCESTANPILIITLNIFNILLRLAGLIAVIYIIVGGFRYVLSEGNPQKAQEAKQTILNALIGALIVVMGSVIISVIVGVIGT